jgi:hypothetical protein
MFCRRAAQVGTRIRRLLELVVDDDRQRLHPCGLFVVLQILLEGGIDAQQPHGTIGPDVGGAATVLAGKEMEQALLAD